MKATKETKLEMMPVTKLEMMPVTKFVPLDREVVVLELTMKEAESLRDGIMDNASWVGDYGRALEDLYFTLKKVIRA